MRERSTPTVVHLPIKKATRRRFSPAEDERLKALHAQGLTVAQICREMDRITNTIYAALDRLGLSPNYKSAASKLQTEKASAAQAANVARRPQGFVPGKASKMNGEFAERAIPASESWYARAKSILGVRVSAGKDCWHLDGSLATVQEIIRESDRHAQPGERISKAPWDAKKPLA